MVTICYAYRELRGTVLCIPHSDPMIYEWPFDYSFTSKKDTKAFLKEQCAEDPSLAEESKTWKLVKITTEVVK